MAFLNTIWDELLFRPIYNLLIWLTSWLPAHDLGLAIIVLTLLIRLVLFLPTYTSLKQQKSLQQLQPKINAVKVKYAKDQQKQAEEVMKLYKEHGVHPCGSCLPILIQLPFLYAVFAVLRDGLNPAFTHYLYAPLANFDLQIINVHFLGLDLTQADKYILPIITGVTQFITMKLTQVQQKEKIQDITPKEKNEPKPMKEIEQATKSMTYLFPVMLAWIATSYPAGLALYWICSTIFGIGQQLILNRRN
ncbi:MAG: YidC/Oxa1 family membrane protein insertase [Candidatus Abawacabacteria bacterium]|nr:YidC/Oxa1 family membrane protein insertase [Candidatus Abawacabacteria bacterium]